MITVALDGSGEYKSIGDAVSSIRSTPETVFIKKGTYNERVEVNKSNITFIGEDKDKTIITNNYNARMNMLDGTKRGTFRSYTMLVHTDHFKAFNLTIENTAGFGEDVGQAIALYAEGDDLTFKNCRILGHQDTLFTGPLPMKEKITGGFTGPTQFSPRRVVHQYFEDCFISGEVDFIFGSATAYFKRCELYALNRGKSVNAYYTAPSTYENQQFGYVFDECRFVGNCPPQTVYLSRPWRIHAQAVFINCYMSDQIIESGYYDWNKPESHDTCYYAEYKCYGEGYVPQKRPEYVKQLTEREARIYKKDYILNLL